MTTKTITSDHDHEWLATGPLLSRSEAAERLAVSKSTIYRLIRSGELPAYKVGHGIRVAQTDLENYIKALPPPVYKEEN